LFAGNVRRVISETIAYRDLDASLTGILFRDEAQTDPRPGILLLHGGAGLDDHAREQARRYAALGYVVLAADLLGEGVAGNRERMVASLTAMRDDPALLVRRGQAGLTVLSESLHTEGPAAAIGFCFGGMAALTLARSGAALAGAVSIHGTLATSKPAGPGAVRARILACHGAQDPHVPLADVTAFAEEMDQAGADWQLIMYGGAQHGFTHRHAVPGAIPGVACNEPADTRSFEATRAFLAGAFAPAT
jgi:dienelactone hydrolase